ncbi:hypothetical protein [Clostridium sp. C8-1-8]|uniref:hypothetical protein n=1 Tax=Clostridium sp. C8-1-8 TaxID=2698831 RepID=UPI0013700424|nr:hypothetical protein [Clostridium sp. C8-1-8]
MAYEKLYLSKHGENFSGYIGTPTGLFVYDGQELCVGDTVSFNYYGDNHDILSGVITNSGNRFKIDDDYEVNDLQLKSIISDYMDLKQGDRVGTYKQFEVKVINEGV